MNSLVALVVLPPRLALRTLDDLHSLAGSAERALDLLERLDARATRIEGEIDKLLVLGETLEGRAAQITAMGDRLAGLGDQLVAEAKGAQAVGEEVARRGAEIAAALPLLQRALDLGEPLEGAIERAGRIVDRLPGGRRITSATRTAGGGGSSGTGGGGTAARPGSRPGS